MKFILLFLLSITLYAESTFITEFEYASQLYKNPRGIGCHYCHGDKGNGKLVATYIHKKEKKRFEGPAINRMDFDAFFVSLNERKKGMPRYYLTKKEIQALYFYLQENR